jgi:Type I phosphodiesterase / nucleotide pyrophosphatase
VPQLDGGRFQYRQRAILLVVSLATLAALLLAAQNDLAPRQSPLSFALVFLGWSLLFYALLLAPVLVALGLANRIGSAGRYSRVGLALVSLVLLLCTVANWEAVEKIFHLHGPARFRSWVPLAFLTAAASLASAGWLSARRLWAGYSLAGVALLSAVIAFWPQSKARAANAAGRSPAIAQDPDSRFVLIGLDGADWRYIEPLIARGELPNIATLRERGTWGPLATFKPTKSPVVWTTIATGQDPPVHGIRDYTNLRLRGVDQPLGKLRLPAYLLFEGLYAGLDWSRLLYKSPVVSSARLTPAYWELATLHGTPVDVVNWWVTWPAEPILGHMVSERAYYFRFSAQGSVRETSRLTYPEALYAEVEGLVMRPDEVTFAEARPYMDVSAEEFATMMASPRLGKHTIEGEFKYLYSMHETTRRISLRLIELSRNQYGTPADHLVLFRITDLASHAALAESELVEEHLGASEERRRKYARVVSEAYRAADRAIGEIATAFGPGNVVVVSDHGFQIEKMPGPHAAEYGHVRAPAGIFIAAGPAFARTRVEGLSVCNVLPLLVYLKGMPVAEDLCGRVPPRVFAADFAARHPVISVASYGTKAASTVLAAESTDTAVMDHMRALGYVQ